MIAADRDTTFVNPLNIAIAKPAVAKNSSNGFCIELITMGGAKWTLFYDEEDSMMKDVVRMDDALYEEK